VTTGQTPSTEAGHELARQADKSPLSWLQRLGRFLVGGPRLGESDARFGRRLALYGPIAFYALLFLVLMLAQVEGEAGLGLTLAYWLFIGVSQLAYLVPGIALALVMKRRGVAAGLAQGAGLVAALNGIAWVVGYYVIGAR
jgi:hypothetical protein